MKSSNNNNEVGKDNSKMEDKLDSDNTVLDSVDLYDYNSILYLNCGTNPNCVSVTNTVSNKSKTLFIQSNKTLEELVVKIMEACKEVEVSYQNLDCIFVNLGPGSSTGIRLAVTFTKVYLLLNPNTIVYGYSLFKGVNKTFSFVYLDRHNDILKLSYDYSKNCYVSSKYKIDEEVKRGDPNPELVGSFLIMEEDEGFKSDLEGRGVDFNSLSKVIEINKMNVINNDQIFSRLPFLFDKGEIDVIKVDSSSSGKLVCNYIDGFLS